jgi:hypothetical protein
MDTPPVDAPPVPPMDTPPVDAPPVPPMDTPPVDASAVELSSACCPALPGCCPASLRVPEVPAAARVVPPLPDEVVLESVSPPHPFDSASKATADPRSKVSSTGSPSCAARPGPGLLRNMWSSSFRDRVLPCAWSSCLGLPGFASPNAWECRQTLCQAAAGRPHLLPFSPLVEIPSARRCSSKLVLSATPAGGHGSTASDCPRPARIGCRAGGWPTERTGCTGRFLGRS